MDNWSPVQWITNFSTTDGWDKRKPAVATDGNSTAVGLWISPGGVNLSRSTNNGADWTPIYVPDVLNPVDVREVHVVHSGGSHWVAVWSVINHSTLDTEFHMGRSSDGGLTWTPPIGIATGLYEIEFDMDTDEGGNVAVIVAETGPVSPGDHYEWIFNRNYNKSHVLHSNDHGVTWSSKETPLVASIPDGLITHYINRISIDSAGTWVAGQSTFGYDGNALRHVETATSYDQGASWTTATLYASQGPFLEPYHLQDVNVDGLTATTLIGGSPSYYPPVPSTFQVFTSSDAGSTWATSQTIELDTGVYPEVTSYQEARFVETQTTELLCLISEKRHANGRPMPLNGYSIMESRDNRSTWTAVQKLYPDATLDISNAAGTHLTGQQFLLLWEAPEESEMIGARIDQINVHTLTTGGAEPTLTAHGIISDLPIENPDIINGDLVIEMGDNGTAIAMYHSLTSWNWGTNRVQRSGNYGRNWEPAKVVQPSFFPRRQEIFARLVDLKYHGQQRWTSTWMQSESGEAKWISHSQDDGRNWSPAQQLPYTAVGSNGSGEMLAAYNAPNSRVVIARSTDAGQTWTNITDIHGPVPIRHIIHSEGNHWLMVTQPGYSLTSSDNGQTWVNIAPVQNISLEKISRITTNHQGVIMSHWGWGDQVIIQRSLDHGYTWHMTRTDQPAGFGTSKKLITVAWAGDDRWVAVWGHQEGTTGRKTLHWSESYDNGTTWVNETELQSDVASFTMDQEAPAIAISGDNAVIGWTTHRTELDSDLGYTFNNYTGATTSANDWTLYE